MGITPNLIKRCRVKRQGLEKIAKTDSTNKVINCRAINSPESKHSAAQRQQPYKVHAVTGSRRGIGQCVQFGVFKGKLRGGRLECF